MASGKRGRLATENGGLVVPVADREEDKFRVGKGTWIEALVALGVGSGRRSESGNVIPVGSGGGSPPEVGRGLKVPLRIGRGRCIGPGRDELLVGNVLLVLLLNVDPADGNSGVPVALTDGRGRRAEAVVFDIGQGRRPETDAL